MPTVMSGPSASLPQGILLGHMSNYEAATGCSVVLCPTGATGSVAVYGGAPATRETDLLAPEKMVQSIHAVVLSGGSAYGLDAAGGVMHFLEEQECGVSFAGAVVPIVVAASLFDLDVGSATIRPDAAMGYKAAALAEAAVKQTGSLGAGTGASVGRFMGPNHAMKGGFGAASVQCGELLVSALVAVNSLGNVYDRFTGEFLAGAYLTKDGKKSIVDALDVLPQMLSSSQQSGNTTIGVVLTNARLSKTEAYRVACTAHDGYARALYPTHTSFDGDAIFALATGEVEGHADVVGALGALAMEYAIVDAARSAESLFGLPSAASLQEEAAARS